MTQDSARTSLLFATGNPGKLSEIRGMKEAAHFEITSLSDYGVSLDIPEDSQTFAGNARQKLAHVLKQLGGKSVWVAADDAGLMIDALHGAPGVRSRRWKDGVSEMTDQEIVDFTIEQMNGIPYEQRDASFVSAVALAHSSNPAANKVFEGRVRGKILLQPDIRQPIEHLPYRQLFYIQEIDRMLGDTEGLPPEMAELTLTHRQRAFKKVFSYIGDLESLVTSD